MHVTFFQMLPTKSPTFLNVIGLNLIPKTNTSFQNFFDSMSRFLDKHVQLKKLSKYKLKFKTKP